MYARPPVTIDCAVTTAAEFLGLIKTYLISLMINELVTIFSAVAVEAPDCSSPVHHLKGILNYILMLLEQSRFLILRDWD